MSTKKKNVTVVVLGDIGRSPRMQYHSLSLAQMGHKVDIIGYGETEPMEALKLEPQIFYHYLLAVPTIFCMQFMNYALKAIVQAVNLYFLLFLTSRTDIVIVQNPPAIPSLIICWIFARIARVKLVIDWHNYAHTMMALSAGNRSPLVAITKKVEAFIGRRADYNFCVTKAMRDDLKDNWGINAAVLYDRPPEMFKSISLDEKQTFLRRFGDEYEQVFDDNTALLVSSTSWTEDEDFSILLSALSDYEGHIEAGNARNLPKLVCAITGKGPLKDYYGKKIDDLKWKHVTIITPWLDAKDYPQLLSSADLGVSLHTSSSALDLPMKVVDMFGCGLPVCAYDFKCLNELLRDGENGYKFTTSEELATLIMNWFESFPNNEKQKEIVVKFKDELKRFQALRWAENWTLVASPVFQ